MNVGGGQNQYKAVFGRPAWRFVVNHTGGPVTHELAAEARGSLVTPFRPRAGCLGGDR